MVRYLKTVGLLLAVLSVSPAQAIGLSSLTTEIPENQFYVTQQIKSDDKVAKFVTVEVTRVDDPKKLNVLSGKKKDVLVSPAMLLLAPRRTGDVKIYYQGPRDDKERYYQISFVEQSVGAENSVSTGMNINARQKIRLSSILVVRPRKIHFAYEQDGTGHIRNSGNTFIRATATGKCKDKDDKSPGLAPCSSTTFLLPGESANLRTSKFAEFGGIGIWRGDDYQFHPASGAPTKISPR